MSDESLDGMDRADEPKEDEDVQAHSLDAPVDSPHATEEPPDVEGHGFYPAPVDPKPVDSPVD